MRVFKSSITSTFGRRERGRVVEVVRARGFQSRHSSLLYNSTRRRERERERESTLRERIKGVVVVVTVLKRFLSSCLSSDSLRKKKKQNASQKRAIWGSQKRKSLLSSNATISSSFFRARAIYTRTVLSRSSTTLSRIHTRYKRETTKTAKREGGRGVLFLWWFCASQRVKESALSAIFPNGFVVHVLWGKFS